MKGSGKITSNCLKWMNNGNKGKKGNDKFFSQKQPNPKSKEE